MVSLRFPDFFLVLIFLLLRFSSGYSYSHQQVKKIRTIGTSGIRHQTDTSSVNVEEEGVGEIEQRTRFGPAERKMMSRRFSKLMESQHGIAKASSSITSSDGEAHCVENCDVNKGKRTLNVKRKLSQRSGRSVRVKMSGFVSWNADYHVPRPHPPKNN